MGNSLAANPTLGLGSVIALGLLAAQPSMTTPNLNPDAAPRDRYWTGDKDNISANNILFGASSTQLSPDLQRSLSGQRKYLLELNEGWDGYGSAKLSSSIIDKLYADLGYALGGVSDAAIPDIIPGSDGAIQAEWHRKKLKLEYQIDTTGERYLAVTPKGAAVQEFFGPHALAGLKEWATLIRQPNQVFQLAA